VGGIRLAVEGREFARSTVGFHLAVPIIIGPTAQFGGDFSAFFNRKHLDGLPDGLNRAHDSRICSKDELFATVIFAGCSF